MKEGHAGWAVRRGDEKLLRQGDAFALYNLKDDLGEQADLSARQKQTVSELTSSFDSWDRLNSPDFIVPYRAYHEQLKAFHEKQRDEKISENQAKREANSSDGR